MILPEAQSGGKAEQTDNREMLALTIQIRTDPVGRGRERKRGEVGKTSCKFNLRS
jgi:hypothetical protein